MIAVLDSSGLLASLWDEPGAVRVRELLASDEPMLMHAVNLIEALYQIQRRGGPAHTTQTLELIAESRLVIVREIDLQLQSVAAQLKVTQTPIALGDTFAVALAMVRGATLVTTDRGELQKVADAGLCEIEFLR